MARLLRALLLATVFVAVPRLASLQEPGVLHVKVTLLDAGQNPTPVPRHLLLISDNPASAPPRRVLTALDGTADIKLAPGTYTVESDRPVVFNGQAYQWTQMVEVAGGRDATIELSAGNAEVERATASATATTTAAAPLEDDPSFLLPRWQDSVVALWSSTARASAFVIDRKGLLATNQRAVGEGTSVEVQLSASLKVAARVLASDKARDVAILWVDPALTAALRPVPIDCANAAARVRDGQEIFAIGAPFGRLKAQTTGLVGGVAASLIVADFRLDSGGNGGPVFTAAGAVVGISSTEEVREGASRGDTRVVPIDQVCPLVKSAEAAMRGAAPPAGTPLPVEPTPASSATAAEELVRRRAGSLGPAQMSSRDFDIALLTPVQVYGARHRAEQDGRRDRYADTGRLDVAAERARLLMDFGNWSEYVDAFPQLLLVRVTPRLVEGFWTMVARGAASTQGMSLPPFKHFKPGFSRMRVFCGPAEVTPIHPFTLEQRLSKSEAIVEGLYVFDPAGLGPECGTIKLMLYSQKEPEKADTLVVDPKVLKQMWQELAP
jgi:S1-C subfamily serine protease